MSLRKRSSSKSSSGRASNKMRLSNNGGVVEIESWVDFVSNHDSDVEQLINPSQLSIKEESKESIYELSATKKRNIKMLENKALSIKCFLNSKDLRMQCFQKWTNRTSIFLIYFYLKNRITLPFPPSKVLKLSVIKAKLNSTETNAKLKNTV